MLGLLLISFLFRYRLYDADYILEQRIRQETQSVTVKSTYRLWYTAYVYKKIIIVVVVFVVAILAITLVSKTISARSQQAAARKVSDQFISYTLAGKYNESYKMFSAQAESNLPQTTWREKVATLALFFTARKSEFLDAKSGGKNTQVIRYSIPGNDGNYTLTVTAVNNSGVWQVDVFDSKLNNE